jgi:arylsulfatase A-like enzyme
MEVNEMPNIILLVIDTLRYDYAMADPYFSDLAKKGMFFERMYSPSTFTNANMTSVRTGMYPIDHGARSWPKTRPISDDIKTIEDYLKEAGYHISNKITMPMVLGETQAFIEDTDLFARKTKHEPFFLYSQYLNIHNKIFYGAGVDTTEKNYRGLIPDAGNFVKLAFQQANKLERETLWVIMSDHGIGLGGDQLAGEGADVGAGQLYDFRVRIYCVILGSDIEPHVLDSAYSLIDLMPTILDYCDIVLEEPQGKSAFDESESNRLVYLEAQSPFSIWPSETPNVFGMTNGKVKLMLTPEGVKFYDLIADPLEKNNLTSSTEDLIYLLTDLLIERAKTNGSD